MRDGRGDEKLSIRPQIRDRIEYETVDRIYINYRYLTLKLTFLGLGFATGLSVGCW